MRQRPKIIHSARQNTTERKMIADDNESDSASTFVSVSREETDRIMSINMQIRPPCRLSAHESKILRKRDKTFISAVMRSNSQPRQAERLSSPEANELLCTVKRSLSSPRQKEISVDHAAIEARQQKKKCSVENLTRLEQNLRKFEEECVRFESEKRLYEKEKHEHRLRYKKLKEHEERKRLLRHCRISNETTCGSEERRQITQSLRPPQYESSTPISSSESEAVHGDTEGGAMHFPKNLNLFENREKKMSPVLKRNISSKIDSLSPEKLKNYLENPILAKISNQTVVDESKGLENVAKISIFSKFFSFFKLNNKQLSAENMIYFRQQVCTKEFLKEMFSEIREEWKQIKADHQSKLEEIRCMRNKCAAHMILLVLFCGFGGLLFRYTEGSFEDIYKCELRKVRRDFIEPLWTASHNMREDDWKSVARTKLKNFEQQLTALQELGVRRSPGTRSWNFVNCFLYCWTVVTTIGYGHITPQTTLGRSITIVYAVIGIPIFLILLADFGKLFTRCVKFIWAYVRRLYYTGTCRQVRKQQQVRGVVDGFNTMCDIAMRRPSMMFFGKPSSDSVESTAQVPQTPESLKTQTSRNTSRPVTPPSRLPEIFEIDDEFNLPVSLATTLLILYILMGAFVYTRWEEWTYFEAFYFVFISMSTIGFGDLVPNHPIFMMCSIIYMVFGLALTSMFINVVQIKLSDTFKHASAKIGATIGLELGIVDNANSVKISPDLYNPLHSTLKYNVSGEELNTSVTASYPPKEL